MRTHGDESDNGEHKQDARPEGASATGVAAGVRFVTPG